MKRRLAILLFCSCSFVFIRGQATFADDARPKVAILPFAGGARADERERAAFSLQQKLDRQGVYEPIDTPTIQELMANHIVDLKTPAKDVIDWTSDESPVVIIWGELGAKLAVHVYDARDKSTKDFSADMPDATQMRFVTEKLIKTLPGSKAFEHPNEEPVTHDAVAEQMWKDGPNLFSEGTFDSPGGWRGLLRSDAYTPAISDHPPDVDRVEIRREGKEQYLEMKLSKDVAESNGLACLGAKIPIRPATRYRVSFRYRSDGPTIHPFIKGYVATPGDKDQGATGEREIYRRQVPPVGATHGQWVTVIDELNPQHPTLTVQYLRFDLYAYLAPGTVEFDDVVIKAVGEQTRHAKDDAMDNVGK